MISRACTGLLRSSRWAGNKNLYGEISSNLRCSSSSTRLWSTPLAKNIAEAIAVSQSATPSNHSLILILDHRPNLHSIVHAAMPHLPRRRLLHPRQGPIWPKGRLHYLAGDLPGLWRASRHMDGRGMDGAGQDQPWGGNDGGGTRKGNFDG